MSSPSPDTDEEELRRAIAMSLEQDFAAAADYLDDPTPSSSHPHPQPTTNNDTGDDQVIPSVEVIDLDSDSDDSQYAPPTSRDFSLSNLDRKQMERDRMERQNSRKRELGQTSPHPDDTGNSKRARQDDGGEGRASSDVRREPGTAIRRNQSFAQARLDDEDVAAPTYAAPRPRDDETSTDGDGLRPLEPEFLSPTIKKTWCFGQPRGGDIKIEEVLQKNHLKLVVLSAFQFDAVWWCLKVDVNKVKQVWIRGVPTEESRKEWEECVKLMPTVQLCLPDLGGNKSMYHAKFFLLSFPKFLRIVVTSANIIDWDWGERGNMENTVFLIDLPRLPEGQSVKEEDLTPFAKEMVYYLRSIGLRDSLLKSFLRFDYSRTKDVAFVHSIAGIYHGEEAHLTGIPSLGRAVKSLNLETDSIEVDYATSSLGALKSALLEQILAAAQGKEIKPYDIKDPATLTTAVSSPFRVYFPTEETIDSSKGGRNAAGTITFNRRYFDSHVFPLEAMRDHQSTRQGILSHCKIMLARGQRKEGDGKGVNVAWVYVGSHNLTESAWGTFTPNKRTKTPKMSIRNFECGVVMRVPEEQLGHWTGQVPDYKVFAGTIDIPFVAPGSRYNGREPWFMDFRPLE